MARISNHTLVKVAALTGIATVTMGLLARYKCQQRIAQTEYFIEAIETMKSNRGAKYILGEPIHIGTVDIDKTDLNYTSDLKARYEVPVKGSKEKGTLYFWAQKEPPHNWTVNRIELGLEKEPNKRLLIKNLENAE